MVVRDENERLVELTYETYRATSDIKRRPIDILVGSESMFNRRKRFASIESEVHRKGVLLYEA